MRTLTRPAARRPGFTLVEVLVAAALCVLIMTVMATAFQAGLDTLSQLKSLAGLQGQLRTAEIVLRQDLQAQHIESSFGNKVSDQRLDQWVPPGQPLPPGQTPAPPAWEPPAFGFFRIYQEPVPPAALWSPDATRRTNPGDVTFVEQIPVNPPGTTLTNGSDPDGIPTTRATGHVLHMAVKLPADRGDQVFTAAVPPPSLVQPLGTAGLLGVGGLSLPRLTNDPTFRGEWAEVIYFLDTTAPTGFTSGTPSAPDGLPLYTLHRRVRPLTEPRLTGAPRYDWRFLAQASPQFQGMSFSPLPTVSLPTPPVGTPPNPVFNPVTGAVYPNNTVCHTLNDPADVTNPHNRLGGIGGIRGVFAPTTPGASPFLSGRYNIGYQPLNLGPHVVVPPGLGPTDLMASERSTFPNATPAPTPAGAASGSDGLVQNVISFEIRANYDVNPFVDLRYNGLLDGSGSLLPADQQTGMPRLANVPQASLPPVPARRIDIPAGAAGAIAVPLTASGGSAYPDGAFDDLPAMPNVYFQNGAPQPVGGNGIHNPVFQRVINPNTGALEPNKPRVFELWGTQLLPTPPSAYNPPTGNVPARADWHAPLAFTYDNAGNPVNVAGNPNCVPLPIRVKALQIKLRVYDPKNKQTRQITIIQDM